VRERQQRALVELTLAKLPYYPPAMQHDGSICKCHYFLRVG
jgi:hypothetical protein